MGEPHPPDPDGHNDEETVYPPGCGPMQLVWQIFSCGITILGWQNDSFHGFKSRKECADYLRRIADRIEFE